MRHLAVPYHLARVGDVIDRPSLGGSNPFAVITHVAKEKAGDGINQVILSVSANGERHRLEWQLGPDMTAARLGRVGQGCAPTPKGLRSFIAKHLS